MNTFYEISFVPSASRRALVFLQLSPSPRWCNHLYWFVNLFMLFFKLYLFMFISYQPGRHVCTPRRLCLQLSILEQLLRRDVKRLNRGLVLKAHRLVCHSTVGSRVMPKKKESFERGEVPGPAWKWRKTIWRFLTFRQKPRIGVLWLPRWARI